MAERAYFVKLNLDDMAASLDALDSTEERGLWLEGFRVGSRGNKSREGWPEAKTLGYEFGLDCWRKAEEFREKQSEKGKASVDSRRKRTGSEPEVNRTPNRNPNRKGSSQKPEAINQETSIQETIIQDLSPPPPQGGKRTQMVPPSEEEWVAYCVKTWPDWHPTCAAESWAYYKAKGWKIGSSPCLDWKAAAKTSHGNARQWGKLQPAPASSPGAPLRSGGPPSVRRTSDQEWMERNPGMLKTFDGGDLGPAF